jgi:hypothetical protein
MRNSYTRNIKKQVMYWYLDDLGNLQRSVVRRPKNAMRTITEITYVVGGDEDTKGTVMEHYIERDGRIVRRFKTTTRDERDVAVPALIEQLFAEMPIAPVVYYWYLPTKTAKRAVRTGPNTLLPSGMTEYLTERVAEVTPGVVERTIGCLGYTETFQTPTDIDPVDLAPKYFEIIKTQARKARTIDPDPGYSDQQIQRIQQGSTTRDLIAQRRAKEEVERQKAITDARRMVDEVRRKRVEREGGAQPRKTRRTQPITDRAVKKVGATKVLKNIKNLF